MFTFTLPDYLNHLGAINIYIMDMYAVKIIMHT